MFTRIRSGAIVAVLLALALASAGAQEGRREPSKPSGQTGATGEKAQPAQPADTGQKAKPRPPAKPAQPDAPATSSHRRPSSVRPALPPTVRGQFVFVGGYFYDPFYGPYPWWQRPVYPYPYYPVFDSRAQVRVMVSPEDAAVYVDGFYAGIADDFNNVFQSLPLTPGGHEITIYLEGYRTVRQRLYLSPGSTLRLRETMERLPEGVRSEPPMLAPPVPPPPPESVMPLRTPPRGQPTAPAISAAPAVGYGSVALRVQPANADVLIDGERWVSSDEGQFIVEISAGTHRLEVAKPGYRRFVKDIQLREGEQLPLNVSLSPETR